MANTAMTYLGRKGSCAEDVNQVQKGRNESVLLRCAPLAAVTPINAGTSEWRTHAQYNPPMGPMGAQVGARIISALLCVLFLVMQMKGLDHVPFPIAPSFDWLGTREPNFK